MLDRVTERRRAARLARHYRDQEGLSISEIARRLGRAEATIKTYLYSGARDLLPWPPVPSWGDGRLGAEVASRDGSGLLAQAELVEFGG
jgi:predicted transcriptional regulator